MEFRELHVHDGFTESEKDLNDIEHEAFTGNCFAVDMHFASRPIFCNNVAEILENGVTGSGRCFDDGHDDIVQISLYGQRVGGGW